jgi:pyruvate,water dikinase
MVIVMIVAMNAEPGARVGGKAGALMRLAAKGFRIPAFLTLTPESFDETGLKPEVRAELLASLPGPGPFAARSSAMEEDGDKHSHAGQFLSLLDLSAGELPEACEKVFASAKQDSVANYREKHGLSGEGGGTAVLVQQMVDARAAGVAFTADPVSGRRDRIVVSVIAGLGDRLVGGEEDGETYVLGRDGSVIERPGGEGILSESDIAALADLAVKVEAACSGPQDMEYAFEGDRLYLLQARPITSELAVPPVVDDTLNVFDNSNIVESYPGLVSPLTYSFAQYAYARVYRAFVALLGVSDTVIAENAAVFDNMLTRIDGRVYYNLGNWYRALALLPGFAINRGYMETMMGVDEPLPAELSSTIGPPPATGPKLWLAWLRVSGSGLRPLWEAIRIRATTRGFYRRLEHSLGQPPSVLDTMSLTQLAQEYRRIEAELLDRWDAPLINDFLCMIAFGASRKMMERWCGQDGLALHNDVMIGQGDIVSAEPARRIRRMSALLAGHEELREALAGGDGSGLVAHPKLKAEIDSYLAKFADRCTEELKLESVTLDRDPTPLYRAIAAGDASGHASAGRGMEGIDDLLPQSAVKRFIAKRAMAWTKARVSGRENLRFERTRIFGRARHLFRAAGRQFHAHGLIEQPDDIYFLTVQEVLGAIEGFAVTPDLAGLVRVRKAEMEAAAARPDPASRLLVRGSVFANRVEAVKAEPVGNEMERRGTGCSAGKVTAKARIIRDPRKEALDKGDILVARHTDPGWIAVFSNASAIVVERGSLLSHSAIVARELGIPCVVALKGAMDWIQDGEAIEVDGASGLVRRLG